MKNFLEITPAYTDLYQLTMGQVNFLKGRTHEEAVFDYFFRKLPFNSGYVVFAGLGSVLELLEDFRFSESDLGFLEGLGLDKEYISYLRSFRFTGNIWAAEEGEVVFPHLPLVRVEGGLMEAQLIETLLLNLINFQSLIATKAARVRHAAHDRVLLDFGLRRAQGLGGYHATRAAMIGGFNGTSNVKAAADFGVRASGTMAHSFIQQFDDELTAFRAFADGRPENCVLLVDTYNTLRSGVPNAIIVAKEMETKGHRLEGIRLDSGDLAYLARHARQMLNDAGLHYVKIAASNQLDEFVVRSLLEQGAPIDVFGVGTSLVTGHPDGALDGVYKLSSAQGKPRIKLSESISKTTLPDRKQIFRLLDSEGNFWGGDAIALSSESSVAQMHHPFEPAKSLSCESLTQQPLLKKVMANGKVIVPQKSVHDIAAFSRERLAKLPPEYKRFEYPHTYKVGISTALRTLRDQIRNQYTIK